MQQPKISYVDLGPKCSRVHYIYVYISLYTELIVSHNVYSLYMHIVRLRSIEETQM